MVDAVEPAVIFLTGFMGAGKTTVGRDLARALGWSFIDLDSLIEAKLGKKISQIFEELGEAEFRKFETQALREVLKTSDPEDHKEEPEPMVVALGGGVFAQEVNRQLMREHGGKVVGEKAANPDEPRGESIEGGETRRLSAGDAIVIPAGVPHWMKDVEGTLLYFVVKVKNP